jgi:hypothetical protein
VDAAGINDILKDMEAISTGIRTRMIKRTLRDWGRMVVKAAKAGVSWRSRKLRRNIIQKVKSYPKGASAARTRRIWVGVGVKRLPGTIREDVGARAHFYEAGWRPWPKGRPTGIQVGEQRPKRQGNYRGQPAARMRAILAFARRMNRWRRRFRRIQGGTKYYETRYLGNAGKRLGPRLSPMIAESANAVIAEVSRGQD